MKTNVVDTRIENDDVTFLIDGIQSVTGDCDVTQRKGKVLCIFDMNLQFTVDVSPKAEDATSTKATITLPEFIHDQEEDEYVFEVTATDYKSEIRKLVLPELQKKLMKFQTDLITAHEQDVQHTTN